MANPNINGIKIVDKSYADIGDTINYTILVSNNGDTQANNIILTDLIPQGANFIPNSIFVNSINQPGVDPALGIDLSTITIGQVKTVTFQSMVVNVPISNPMNNIGQLDFQYVDSSSVVSSSIDTNSSLTTISAAVIQLSKSGASTTSVGNTITYSITISNIGSTTANNLIIIDTIPLGTTFVPGSANINGTPVGSPESPGINAGDLPNGFLFNLVFDVTVVSVPPSGTIQNQCISTCDYIVDPNSGTISSGLFASNIKTSYFSLANLEGITKSVDKAFATCGEILTYTITIPNSGNVAATNVVLKDTIPNGMSLISNSVVIDGTTIIGANPQVGLNIGTILSGAISTVVFKAQINC